MKLLGKNKREPRIEFGDRCVWGTDWPHPNASFMPNDGDLVDLLADWVPDEALRHRVLVENPAQLYSF